MAPGKRVLELLEEVGPREKRGGTDLLASGHRLNGHRFNGHRLNGQRSPAQRSPATGHRLNG
ncbi:hypothetical protein EYF80_047318 [Liparis tanakae]|uniref:Uncharacterized protein n=1 Tax=Liparis tanakae TaxID=230148 RepID=A0A4Z2FNY5_9TELE|nr:hypothetical protein EYF80_047318 [Liparis tanakae]